MSKTTQPPSNLIDEAFHQAVLSPCARSKFGAVIWDPSDFTQMVSSFNSPPDPFVCGGSDECRAACSMLCEHAPLSALGAAASMFHELEMLVLKVVMRRRAPMGPPSCWQCSRAILADGRIAGVWLYHYDGWRRYEPAEFHELTLMANRLPVLRGPR